MRARPEAGDSVKLAVAPKTKTPGEAKILATKWPLCVHRTVAPPGARDLSYTVTHIPSGYRMPPTFESLRCANEVMKLLANLQGWQHFRTARGWMRYITRHPRFLKNVRRILIEGGAYGERLLGRRP